MKKGSKIIAGTLLTIFAGTQLVLIQPGFTQEYKLVPPAGQGFPGLNPNYPQGVLPVIDANGGANYKSAPLKGQISTVPAGTVFEVITNSTLGTSTSQVGDIFTATITKPVMAGGGVIIPEGSEAIGQVTYLESAGRAGKNGSMEIRFTNIKTPYGNKIPISGRIITTDKSGVLRGGSIKKQIVTSVATGTVITGGGTLAGLTLGSLMGAPGGGAVFGTAAGGLFGLGYIVARKGKEVVVPSDTTMNVVLDQPLTVGK